MAKPIILRTKAETEGTVTAFARLAQVAVTSMGSVSAAAVASHQATGSSLGHIADKAMTTARSIGALAAAHQLAVGAFGTYMAAVAAGTAELDKFQQLAAKAAASNVGTTYFQAFTVGAQQLGAELKKVEGDLAALERSARTRFSADSLTGRQNKAIERFEGAFLDVPTSQGSPALDMLRNAKDAEEQLRALTRGLADLEAQGRQLLAIDIARDLGMRELPDLVERGKTKFVDFMWSVRELEATGIKNGSLVSPELITRADELRDRFAKVATNLANNVRPILDECARLALDMGNHAAWTAEQFGKIVGVVGTIVGFLREAVNLVGRIGRSDVGSGVLATDRIAGLREEIQETQRQLSAIPQPRFGADIRAAERETLQARIVQMRGEIEAISQMAAEERRGRALSALPAPAGEPIIPTDRSATKAPPLDTSRRANSRAAAAETDEWVKAYDKLINNMEKANAQLEAEFATVGKSNVERTKAVELAKAESEARRTGGTLTEEQRNRVLALAEAQAKLRDAIKDAEAAQRAFADAIQYAGDRLVDMAFNGRSLQDVLRGLAAELMRAALTGQGVFGKLLGLAPSAGASAGSVGGLLGLLTNSFSSSLGGSLGGNAAALSPFALFQSGGYTGAGDPSQLAGGVHRGEFVFDAASTSRIGVDTLEAIRSARAGPPRMAELASAAAGVNVTNHYSIDARGADEAAIARLERGLAVRDAEFESRVIAAVRDGQDRRML